MIDYAAMPDPEGEPGDLLTCDGCEVPAPLHDFGRLSFQDERTYAFCQFCGSSPVGMAMVYPNQHRQDYDTLKAVAAIMNMALNEMRPERLSLTP